MTDEAKPAKPKKKTGRPKGKRTGKLVKSRQKVAKILDLAARGIGNEAIARAIPCSPGFVGKTLESFKASFKELENLKEYRTAKRDLLDATELGLLRELNDGEKLAKASINQVAYAFQQVHTAGRLESGQSTANISTRTVTFTQPVDLTQHTITED